MEVVRNLCVNEQTNRVLIGLKDDEGGYIIVRYEEGTDFEDKIVDLLFDILTSRLRVSRRVSPFLNALSQPNNKANKRTYELLDSALGLDRPYSLYTTKEEQERRRKATLVLRARLYNIYLSNKEVICCD